MTPAVVKLEVLAAVDRRRSQREKFIEILASAYDLHATARLESVQFGFTDVIQKAIDLYNASLECAIHDFVETALDPAIYDFFAPHVSGLPWWRR
ncbi:hypothetical protein SPRG_15887 [Saprolegnia parasitica CBS 223.65]|uniref:Uncharacterized protein n=1 Tax=Saprolegnia parasitica (strain CBS 223.65) TaxID=695850 RepID=A0A067BWY0_SAPPC|nr:hypothetical protein SPRG_15887 [Saprolegnia parasitica CBS 223.65]KDO18801.1 hypothetical protein SPRG_15887 [Saprolegnia parasitica CBS 223.65]|eukprot:XP_012210484.1 hypothetical protein SPRG_15887 [Saprolegnia parasitica CBS 223.65]